MFKNKSRVGWACGDDPVLRVQCAVSIAGSKPVGLKWCTHDEYMALAEAIIALPDKQRGKIFLKEAEDLRPKRTGER